MKIVFPAHNIGQLIDVISHMNLTNRKYITGEDVAAYANQIGVSGQAFEDLCRTILYAVDYTSEPYNVSTIKTEYRIPIRVGDSWMVLRHTRTAFSQWALWLPDHLTKTVMTPQGVSHQFNDDDFIELVYAL
jgi:hypothetical protein